MRDFDAVPPMLDFDAVPPVRDDERRALEHALRHLQPQPHPGDARSGSAWWREGVEETIDGAAPATGAGYAPSPRSTLGARRA